MRFPENCIFVKIVTFGGKAIAGTAKISPFILAYWPMMERCPHGMITVT